MKIKKSAGCFVITKKNNKSYVLLQEKLFSDGTIGWVPPKGAIEENEKEEEAAIRETQEETGLQNMSIVKELERLSYEYIEENTTVRKTVIWFLATTNKQELEAKKLTKHEMETQKQVKWIELTKALDTIKFKNELDILKKIITYINNNEELIHF